MSKVILQPAGNGDARVHFINTIENLVPLSKIEKFVSPDVFQKLQNLYKEGSVPVWGVTPGRNEVNKHKWEKVQSGDVALFARDKIVFASATVAFTTHNKELALSLWGTDVNGAIWEYIYFLDEVEEQKIPYEKFNKAAGYASNFIIQGFNVLEESKSSRILTLLDLQSDTYFPEVKKEDYFRAIAEPGVDQPLDKISQVKGRTEQAFLRNNLFKGNKVFVCGICQLEFPVNFLVAAHIKKRADCTEEEKRDYQHIIMPMCKFGCDDLYERGYIAVDSGKVISTETKYKTAAIKQYLEKIIGNTCSYWSEHTIKYFKWHKDMHSQVI